MQSVKKGLIQPCSDTSDAIPFLSSQQLYLKPIACFHISVQLPSHKLKEKSVSNKEIVDKLKHWIEPETLTSLRVSKSTLEFIRFDAEIEDKSKLRGLLSRLNGKTIKLSNISELLKIRASEAKPDFPTKHDWDAYFRDARNMNEMKAGERPDTIYLANLPCEWFKSRYSFNKPCETIFRRAFEQFGEVSRVDIPILDRYRTQMKAHISGIKIFTFNQDTIFEGYVQFREYSAFMKAMDALRGMKLLYKDDRDNAFTASIKVEFDKTKHMSDALVLRRNIVREKIMQRDREREEKERRRTEEEERKNAEEREKKMARRKLREEKRKEKQLAKMKQKDVIELNKKIEMEEKLVIVAQRKLESIRLLGELFDRVKNEKLKKMDEPGRMSSKREKKAAPKTLQDLVKVDNNFDEEHLKKLLIEKYKRKQSIESEENSKFSREGESNRSMRSVVETVHKDVNGMDHRNSYRGYGNYRRGGQRYWNDDHDFRDEGPSENNRYYRGTRGRGRYSARGRGNYQRWRNGFELPPLPMMDPLLLQYTHDYYKYIQMVTKRGTRNKRSSRSRTRSYSRHRSRSRSYSRSRSRSRSHGRHRTRSRSYSRSSRREKRSKSITVSRSRSRVKSTPERKRTKSKSVSKSRSRSKSTSERKRSKSKDDFYK